MVIPTITSPVRCFVDEEDGHSEQSREQQGDDDCCYTSRLSAPSEARCHERDQSEDCARDADDRRLCVLYAHSGSGDDIET
jgi:hypothetical protein